MKLPFLFKSNLLLVGLLAFAGLDSGCKSKSGHHGPGFTPLTIESISPADGAMNVNRSSKIVVTFNQDLLAPTETPFSVDSSNARGMFQVIDQTQPSQGTIPGEIRVEGRTMTYTPTNELRKGVQYLVALKSDANAAQSFTDVLFDRFLQDFRQRFALNNNPISESAKFTTAELVRIEISPITLKIAKQTPHLLIATGICSDGTTASLNGEPGFEWSIDDLGVASIDNTPTEKNGLVIAGGAPGTTTIRAKMDLIEASIPLEVTNADLTSLEIVPSMFTIPQGLKQDADLRANFSDGTQQEIYFLESWTSNNTSVATVSASGLITAVNQGDAVVTASFLGATDTAPVQVTQPILVEILITPSNDSLPLGFSTAFKATGKFSHGPEMDITEQVEWSSSNNARLIINNNPGTKGQANTVSEGSVNIIARFNQNGMNVDGTTKFTVLAPVVQSLVIKHSLQPGVARFLEGQDFQFHAEGMFSDGSTRDITDCVMWESLAPSKFSISNASNRQGVATGKESTDPNTVRVKASKNGVSAEADLIVLPVLVTSIEVRTEGSHSDSVSVPEGINVPWEAIGTFNNGDVINITQRVNWTSTSPFVASICNSSGCRGIALAEDPGVAGIRATLDGISDEARMEVTPKEPIRVDIVPEQIFVEVGEMLPFTLEATFTDGSVEDVSRSALWTSTDPSVMSISDVGQATANGVGSCLIRGRWMGLEDESRVSVDPAAP